jgi:hypothetical protein
VGLADRALVEELAQVTVVARVESQRANEKLICGPGGEVEDCRHKVPCGEVSAHNRMNNLASAWQRLDQRDSGGDVPQVVGPMSAGTGNKALGVAHSGFLSGGLALGLPAVLSLEGEVGGGEGIEFGIRQRFNGQEVVYGFGVFHGLLR